MKIVAAFLVLALVASAHAQEHGSFTISSAPTGVAPQEVRDGWIGLTIPFDEVVLCSNDIFGNPFQPPRLGYTVTQAIALKLLKVHSPESFRWWNDNGFPTSSVAGFCFFTEPLVG
jgi:hypothetical protein